MQEFFSNYFWVAAITAPRFGGIGGLSSDCEACCCVAVLCRAVMPLHWQLLARPDTQVALCAVLALAGRDRSAALRRREEYEGGLDYDLGNLMASDPSPVDAERLRADPDGTCLELATRITQSLVARLFELPSEVRRQACHVLPCRSAGQGTQNQGRRAGQRLQLDMYTLAQRVLPMPSVVACLSEPSVGVCFSELRSDVWRATCLSSRSKAKLA